MSEMVRTVRATVPEGCDSLSVNGVVIDVAPAGRAQELNAKVTATLSWMDQTREEAKHRIAALGGWLLEISEKQLYRELGHPTISRYLADAIAPFSNLKLTQLYACMSVVKHLASHAPPEQIERIGISKAYELAQAVRRTGRAPGEQLLLDAETMPVAEFRAAVAERFELREGEAKPEHETWYDFEGFYVTNDELKEILYVIELVKRIDPVVDHTKPDHIQRKEVFLRMVHEIRATYESQEAREAP